MLDDSDVRFYRRFLRSLTRQVRHLRHIAADARDGVPRLQAAIALSYAALCMAGQQRHIRTTSKRLSDELMRQILPDGGHISRNPGALIELLVDLLPLRTTFTSRNVAPPQALLNAIDRMMPMLRFFRHGDGNFALFNGMGPTRTDLLTTILAYDDARGAPLANAPHSGFQRMEGGGSLVVMDTGRAPPLHRQSGGACRLPVVRAVVAAAPHRRQLRIADYQSRELAAGRARNRRPFHRHVQRHLLLPLHRIGPLKRMLAGTPMIGGPQEITIEREQHDSGTMLRTSHDGYADFFNLIHERVLLLSNDGQRLEGEDVFTPARANRCRPAATSSPSASICIPRSRRPAWRTGAAPCC